VLDKTTIIKFSLGSSSFGIDVHQTVEVERYVQLSTIPRMPRYVAGFVNIRGQLVIVMDLRKQLGFRQTNPTSETRILVAKISGESIGFIVDSVEDIIELHANEVMATGGFSLRVSENLVTGVYVREKEWITILDFDAIIHESEMDTLRSLKNESRKRTAKK
jgi:purine-binding chemotaxis protein CheW